MEDSTIIEMQEFKIIGISVRTTNKNGQSQNDIGQLWEKFIGQKILEQIPNKDSNDIYCMYTDYETDLNGSYTTIIGCRVNSFEKKPNDFIGLTIPSSTYLVCKSIGKIPDSVVNTWINIWQMDIHRKYTADFDLYGPGASDPEQAVVVTYVSI